MYCRWAVTPLLALVGTVNSSMPQTPPIPERTIQRISTEGRERSQLYRIAHELLDSIGPRLTGSPEQKRANDWAISVYQKWGIPVRAEQYGTWKGWRRGTLHVDLIAPRTRSLEGMLLVWSKGIKGPVEGQVVLFPSVTTEADFRAWLPEARGKFIALLSSEPSCRPDDNWKLFAAPGSFERMQKERGAAREAWMARVRAPGLRAPALFPLLAEAGVLGVLTPLQFAGGWGSTKIGSAVTDRLPELGLSCEDYGLLFRLAENNQHPVLRVDADAEFLAEAPVSNVIAEVKGKEKPGEYVVLSGHFDSWDAASGATDNGATSLAIMEAMRILKAVYPNPKRTILAGHWNGEEQGMNGSRAFAADHPEIVKGIQVVLNHDNGTGRVNRISTEGFAGAGPFLRGWLSRIPAEISGQITVEDPGSPSRGNDHASFTCYGAPAFMMSSIGWDYEKYTWHSNRDTFDKLVFDDVKSNAMLLAMLAYLASENTERVPGEPRVTTIDSKTGRSTPWPACQAPARTQAESGR